MTLAIRHRLFETTKRTQHVEGYVCFLTYFKNLMAQGTTVMPSSMNENSICIF